MIAAFIFIMILLSLLFCCSCSQFFYQEGFDNSIGSTGSTGSTGSVDGSLHYDNRYEERRRLMDNPITTNDEYNAILRSMNLSGSTGSTGSIGSSGLTGPIEVTSVDEYNHYESNHHNNNYGYDSDDYILKTMIVPPVCPACPNIIYPDASAFKSIDECKKNKKDDKKNKKDDKKQKQQQQMLAPTQNNSSYSNIDAWSTTPYPILKDFTTYGM
jgi:hypothetical protein